ncbi:hypothetical protein RclHR1_00220051 [Rhizophagus clarus]|uniref:Uncharacterized protein n=1 Tax=Rhizophagus clarus TaxID=94130 RepID=A0A2Z6QTU4_9GLOM|nr:hypothetical protein RclHR1_00220051 [Rhizophagus clarus]GES84594.1 hypothetical protein GLOIN_2v1882468 [Rhizophagus clarus]
MRRFILFSFTAFCLVGLFNSFKLVNLLPPQQVRSKLTGSPVWHGEIENFDQQVLNSGTLVPILLIFCSTIISMIFSYKKSKTKAYISYFIFPDYPSTLKNNPSNITTRSFNKMLAYYTLFVFITSLNYYILEPGKLWSTLSSLHNLIELIIIFFLTLEGQIHNNTFLIFFICSSYIVLINLLTIMLKWPLDYIVFKMQNLILDFTLVILFSRIYLHTYYYTKEQKRVLPSHSAVSDDQEDKTTNKKLKFITHPNQVLLLPFAALVHVFGIIASYVLINNIIGNIVFLVSTAIAFSMYSFYIYLDTHYAKITSNSKNIVLPYTPVWNLILIILWSIILSSTTIRVIMYKKRI